MASNKKSILLYVDWKDVFCELKDSDAGRLIKHILSYVNDESPTDPSGVVKMAWIPIKAQLKRDLKKWEEIKVKRSEAGKTSAEKRKQNPTKPTSVECVEQSSTKSTVTVTDTVTVNVTDTVKDIYKKQEVEVSVEFEKIFSEIMSDVVFQEGVAMQIKLPLSTVQENLHGFLNELKLKEDYQKGVKKIKQHFINWLKIQKEKSSGKKESKIDHNISVAESLATKYANENE